MIIFRFFEREDFQEYSSWFDDETLNRELGPLDDEWLQAVLNEDPRAEYVFFRHHQMISIIGIAHPSEEHAEHSEWVIASVAVNPQLRGQGIGRETIGALQRRLAKAYPESARTWVAIVDRENAPARAFFEKTGWTFSKTADESGMYRAEMEFVPPVS